MKKIIIVVMLGVAGYFAYDHLFHTSEAYAAYQRFADAMLHDRWDEAEELAGSGEVRARIHKKRLAVRVLGANMYRGLRGHIHWGPARDVLSEDYFADGREAHLKVVQELRRGSETMAPVGPATVRHHQDVTLVKTERGWRVQRFDEEIERLSDR